MRPSFIATATVAVAYTFVPARRQAYKLSPASARHLERLDSAKVGVLRIREAANCSCAARALASAHFVHRADADADQLAVSNCQNLN